MPQIRFLKQRNVEALRKNIRANLPWYRGESLTLVGAEAGACEEMKRTFDWSCFDTLNGNRGEKDDKANAISVYQAFGNLSPQQAADERIWIYATHFGAPEYAATRWKIPKGADDDKAERHIHRHFFGRGNRGFTRDNAISRLWWIGHAASRCKGYDLAQALRFILWDQEVRKNILERSLGMSAEVLGGLVRVMEKNWDNSQAKKEDSPNPKKYNRDKFRLFMRRVHRRGGRIMLNILSKEQLDEQLEELFNLSLSQDGV
ncbi:MAG: DUF6339 family protein [Gammaproteobacteria bacterium]